MSDIDKSLIGDVVGALPMDKMIGGPLQAMISAQVQASKAYVDFLTSICIKDGKAVSVNFDFQETLVDDSGLPILDEKGEHSIIDKHINVPLISMVSHPNISIEEGTIDFELEVSQMSEDKKSTDMEGSVEGSLGWGPLSLKVKGRVAQKSEQTRKTDTRAKYSIHTRVARQEPPEALQRVIEFLVNSSTKPIVGKSKQISIDDNSSS